MYFPRIDDPQKDFKKLDIVYSDRFGGREEGFCAQGKENKSVAFTKCT